MRRGTGLFWATLAAYALVDVALLALPRLAVLLSPESAARLLAYLILGAAALSLAWLAASVALAVRARRVPGGAELARAALVAVLLAGHLLLILRARR